MAKKHERESSGKSTPGGPQDADWGAAMELLDYGRAPLPKDAGDPLVGELLAHWDELPPEGVANLEAHPAHSPGMQLMRDLQGWLDVQVAGTCPPAEDIYDYARGPGFDALPFGRRGEVANHLARCTPCESLAASLEIMPPVPLDLAAAGVPELNGAQETHIPGQKTRWKTPWRGSPVHSSMGRWLPMAAAAAVLIGSFKIYQGSGSRLPEPALYRGVEQEALQFPRGRILAAGTYLGAAFVSEPRFEVLPVPGASKYRVTLRSHGGGAFERGVVVARLESDRPTLISDEELTPGHYTWEAWAVVDGLDRALGERDLQVVADPTVASRLDGRDMSRYVRLLDAAGYVTDARHLARRLPPSAEREAYLAPPPTPTSSPAPTPRSGSD